MPQKKKRNHWVPQVYLRSFAADPPARKKIWRMSKEAGPPELKPIKKVAVRFYLYADRSAPQGTNYDLEDKLASLEEMFAHPYWDVISTGVADLSPEPVRRMIALLTAVMMLRNPAQLEFIRDLHKRQVEFFSSLPSLPDTFKIGGKTYDIDKSSWPDFRDADDEAVKHSWMEHLGSGAWLAEMLLKMRFGILLSEEPVFITTDNPVAVVHPSLQFKGLKNPETCLLFPLSPTRVLFMDNRHSEPDGQYYESADPAGLNGLLWRNSLEYMFSHRDPYDVCVEIDQSAKQMGL